MRRTREFLEKLLGRSFEYFEVWGYWNKLPYFIRVQIRDGDEQQTIHVLYPDSIELNRLHVLDLEEERAAQLKKMVLEVMSQEEIDRIDREVAGRQVNVETRDS